MAERPARAAQRAALLEIAVQVADGLRSGDGGADLDEMVQALAAMPRAPLDLAELIGRESRRRRPDPHLVTALGFVCGQSLDLLRYGLERGDREAVDMFAHLKARLLADARAGRIGTEALMLIAKQFGIAKLDVGQDLRGTLSQLLDEEREETGRGGADASVVGDWFADLAEALGHDPFAIHAELAETALPFPTDHRLAMAQVMLTSDAPAVRAASLGWLLDPSEEVAAALCGTLAGEAAAGRLGGSTLRRLVTMRNWLRADTRAGLDSAVRIARRSGVEPEPLPVTAIEDLYASGFDGSGAASVFARVRQGKRHAMASILFRLGHGIRDAWVQHDLSRATAQAQIARVASETDLARVSPDTLRRLLSHMLTANAAGTPPPFGALDAIEVLGLGVVNPEPLCLPEAIAGLAAQCGDEERSAALADSARWPARFPILDSWFEDDPSVAAILATRKGLTRARRSDLVLSQVVAPRRAHWAEMLGWTALLMADHDPDAAIRFAVAAEVAADPARPIEALPLLRVIADTTLEAIRSRT